MGGKRRGGGGGGNSSSRGSNNNKRIDGKNDEPPSHSATDNGSLLDDDAADHDFCQRFFGDPLFSNRNVSLLFVFATVLPMLAWIPHFLSEYRRLRQIQYLEEERQLRMQKARMEVEHQRKLEDVMPQIVQIPNTQEGDIQILDENPGITKSTILQRFDTYYESSKSINGIFSRHTAQEKFRPTLCPDGKTIGYDNWFTLRDAISEVNAIAAEEFLRWNEYLMIAAKNNSLEPPVYTPPDPFVVCPGVVLNQKSLWGSMFSPSYWASSIYSVVLSILGSFGYSSTTTTPANHHGRATSKSKNKLSSIFINAEDITIECVMCTVDLPGTHFSFGPHAKNVKIKGFTFRGATTSSLTFHHHGADVHLEDCYWLYNSGGVVSNNRAPHANVNGADGLMSPPPGSTTTAGAVADLNSTSTVAFYRCVIDDQKQSPRKATTGAGVANVPGMNPPAGHVAGPVSGQAVATSSFTIRN
jgi:hypothetical protein